MLWLTGASHSSTRLDRQHKLHEELEYNGSSRVQGVGGETETVLGGARGYASRQLSMTPLFPAKPRRSFRQHHGHLSQQQLKAGKNTPSGQEWGRFNIGLHCHPAKSHALRTTSSEMVVQILGPLGLAPPPHASIRYQNAQPQSHVHQACMFGCQIPCMPQIDPSVLRFGQTI